MAGTTTASRAAWGVIASSEMMNPEKIGGYLLHDNQAYGNFSISNIPTSDYRDLEVMWYMGNQSTWVTNHGFGFNNDSGNMMSQYFYWGWSTGSSPGYQANQQAYVYPCGYSSYGFTGRLYISNYSSNSNTKAFTYDWHYAIGSATSYACTGTGAGTYRSTSPITSIQFSQPYANGSSSYQGWLVTGRNPKD